MLETAKTTSDAKEAYSSARGVMKVNSNPDSPFFNKLQIVGSRSGIMGLVKELGSGSERM
jgi:hypothetical protein